MFHDHGIMVNPGMVFGFDNDDESVFESTLNFLIRNRVELAYFNVLTPLPGTALYDRYTREGRIFDRDWAKYDGKHVVFRPKRMTPEQLQEGFFWVNHEFYSLGSIWNRLRHTSQRLIPRIEMNYEFRKLVKRSCPQGTLSPIASVLKNLQAKLPSAGYRATHPQRPAQDQANGAREAARVVPEHQGPATRCSPWRSLSTWKARWII